MILQKKYSQAELLENQTRQYVELKINHLNQLLNKNVFHISEKINDSPLSDYRVPDFENLG